MKVFPATVSVPERDDVDVFACAENETEPAPDPLAPAVTVSQVVLLFAVQVHPAPAVTLTDPLDAADPIDAEADPRVYVQSVVPPEVVNELDGVLGADPPGPTATTRAS